MKRGLKKKGSSLVAVLVICSIILVVASTMIGVATSNVRMRMNESKKLQNLYKADSGLEVVNIKRFRGGNCICTTRNAK